MKPYSLIATIVLLTACTQAEKSSQEDTALASDSVKVEDTIKPKVPVDSMPDVDTTAMQLPTVVPPVDQPKVKTHEPELVVERELPDPEVSEELTVIEPPVEMQSATSTVGHDESDATQVFQFVDEMPRFKNDLSTYLREHIRYPEEARKEGVEGRVFVQFIVTSDGSVKDVSLLKGINKVLDNEALRVIREMPERSWNPGKQNGKAVSVLVREPVVFKLQE